jgi:hypothetical protein
VYKVKPRTHEEMMFYENMAEFFQPTDASNEHKCSICAQYEDPVLGTSASRVTCAKCGTTGHLSCLAHWAGKSNIGIPHVFRCFQCFNLVKLDKEFVGGVLRGEIAPRPAEIKVPDKNLISQKLRGIEQEGAPKAVEVLDPLAGANPDEEKP